MDNFHQFYIQNKPLIPSKPGVTKVPRPTTGGASKTDQKPQVSFDEFLHNSVKKQEDIKLSNHARERARSRNITLDERQMARLGSGVEKAAQKGAREALVLVDQIAAIVSVDNKTVITVTDTGMFGDNVFTNIDSAVIA